MSVVQYLRDADLDHTAEIVARAHQRFGEMKWCATCGYERYHYPTGSCATCVTAAERRALSASKPQNSSDGAAIQSSENSSQNGPQHLLARLWPFSLLLSATGFLLTLNLLSPLVIGPFILGVFLTGVICIVNAIDCKSEKRKGFFMDDHLRGLVPAEEARKINTWERELGIPQSDYRYLGVDPVYGLPDDQINATDMVIDDLERQLNHSNPLLDQTEALTPTPIYGKPWGHRGDLPKTTMLQPMDEPYPVEITTTYAQGHPKVCQYAILSNTMQISLDGINPNDCLLIDGYTHGRASHEIFYLLTSQISAQLPISIEAQNDRYHATIVVGNGFHPQLGLKMSV